MLVLSRKTQESISINDDIVVKVLKIRGNQVKIGIDAPVGVPVHRKEVHEKLGGREVAMTAVRSEEGMPR
jgi:carbon storage regulator